MQPEQLETIYAMLAEALGRVGEEKAALLLATLALDLVANQADFTKATEAIERAERLAGM